MNYEEMLRSRGGRTKWQSLPQIVHDDPLALMRPGFAETLITELLDIVGRRHSERRFRLCYAPETVLADRHGHVCPDTATDEIDASVWPDFTAPEIAKGGALDERTDIYSLGRLLLYIDGIAQLPEHYVDVARVASNEIPEDRYDNIDEMRAALSRRGLIVKAKRYGLIVAAAAVALAFIALIGRDMLPQRYGSEYVRPADKGKQEDYLDPGFDPRTELGIPADYPDTADITDTASLARQQIKQYQSKCEQIFRKRYAVEAQRILAKIYTKEYMGAGEQKFMAGSLSVTTDLLEAQKKIADESQLSDIRAQQLASEIIDQVTEQFRNKR